MKKKFLAVVMTGIIGVMGYGLLACEKVENKEEASVITQAYQTYFAGAYVETTREEVEEILAGKFLNDPLNDLLWSSPDLLVAWDMNIRYSDDIVDQLNGSMKLDRGSVNDPKEYQVTHDMRVRIHDEQGEALTDDWTMLTYCDNQTIYLKQQGIANRKTSFWGDGSIHKGRLEHGGLEELWWGNSKVEDIPFFDSIQFTFRSRAEVVGRIDLIEERMTLPSNTKYMMSTEGEYTKIRMSGLSVRDNVGFKIYWTYSNQTNRPIAFMWEAHSIEKDPDLGGDAYEQMAMLPWSGNIVPPTDLDTYTEEVVFPSYTVVNPMASAELGGQG